ncbi:MAG: NAD-dependent epimerase/dehydratase family protein [Akkermansiaceae bacterium]|nr:NAD-dependent epimerase/dehydratase family protein [Armatimonadota bacterium]
MDILFIGGTGLISTATARKLIADGHQVTCFNRGKSESRLEEGSYEVILGDRKDYATFENTFSDKTFDVVVDMVAFSPDDTASAIRAFKGRCGQFLHCSTVCVYSGPPTLIPTPEHEPFHSIGGYGKNKIKCEEALFTAYEADGFPVTILRPSHSYGEGGNVIRSWGKHETFLDRVRKNKPVIVHGDGTSLWASCHVDDVGRGFIATIGVDACKGQAYNITADEWFTWNDYHRIAAEVAGGTFDPCYIPTDILREVAPALTGGTYEIFAYPSVFDNGKIKRDTAAGPAPYTGQTVSFREGVARNIAWMDENGKVADTDATPAGPYEDSLVAVWRSGVNAALPRMA